MKEPAVLALTILALAVASCSSGVAPPSEADPSGSAAGSSRSAADEIEADLEKEVGRRFRGPHLQSYLMLPDSFVGGSFPQKIADLLREVQELEHGYVLHLERRRGATGAGDRRVLDAHKAFEEYAGLAADLYELMASEPGSIRSMRDGLEISDEGLSEQYNLGVDEVNAAHDRFDAALRALTTDQQASFSRMGVLVRLQPGRSRAP